MTFDDGLIKIYDVTNSAQPGEFPIKLLENPESYYFHEESIGITRYYEALKAGQVIERVISIPSPATVSINQIVVFEEGDQYQIRMVQPERDDLGLKVIKLSLERNGDNYEINE